MKKLSGFLLLFVFLCCSLSAKETQIIIFSTNDMHGSIDNFAKIASYTLIPQHYYKIFF